VNDVVRLFRRQLESDLRGLPGSVGAHLSGERRLERAGNIAELRAEARPSVPPVIFDFVDGGAGDEATVDWNRADLEALALVPHALVDVTAVDTATTVLGRPIAIPIMGAPAGLCGLVHHDGEVALARAMRDAGSIYPLPAMSSYTIEDVVAAAPGAVWFQTYLWRDRGLVGELLDRAAAVDVDTVVVKIDVPVSAARDRDRRNRFGLPPRSTARTVAAALGRPRWTWNAVRRPRLTAANVALGEDDAVSIAAYVDRQFDPSADWHYLEWLRGRWPGKLVVKGILRPADATAAVALGAGAIAVSNHGGRQLDYATSTIAALPGIVEAVGDSAEVYLDGGIRRGSDVLKAVALGARACMIGRPLLWGLAVGGEAGARRAVELLAGELRAAMALAGVPDLAAAGADLIQAGGAR
jgi:isopentenyl diphosphate isomerase/L-lactate dehydrogenase-like FMN-dependent dehydrogenase